MSIWKKQLTYKNPKANLLMLVIGFILNQTIGQQYGIIQASVGVFGLILFLIAFLNLLRFGWEKLKKHNKKKI